MASIRVHPSFISPFNLLQGTKDPLRCDREVKEAYTNCATDSVPDGWSYWWQRGLADPVDLGDPFWFQKMDREFRRCVFE
jgi:hypothetical protein